MDWFGTSCERREAGWRGDVHSDLGLRGDPEHRRPARTVIVSCLAGLDILADGQDWEGAATLLPDLLPN